MDNKELGLNLLQPDEEGWITFVNTTVLLPVTVIALTGTCWHCSEFSESIKCKAIIVAYYDRDKAEHIAAYMRRTEEDASMLLWN
jgi:hypothetical protein